MDKNPKEQSPKKMPLKNRMRIGAVTLGLGPMVSRALGQRAASPLAKKIDFLNLSDEAERIREKLMAKAPPGVREISVDEVAGSLADRYSKGVERLSFGRIKSEEVARGVRPQIDLALRKSGPAYSVKDRGVINVQNAAPEILAHELGHAQAHARLGKLYSGGSSGARLIGNLSPLILGAGAYKYFTEKDRDPQKARKWRNRTLGISGLATGLVLADEFEASRKGLKTLREIGGRRPGQVRNLAKALGTYGATFGTPLALAGGIYAWDAHRTRKKAREAMAANTKQASAEQSPKKIPLKDRMRIGAIAFGLGPSASRTLGRAASLSLSKNIDVFNLSDEAEGIRKKLMAKAPPGIREMSVDEVAERFADRFGKRIERLSLGRIKSEEVVQHARPAISHTLRMSGPAYALQERGIINTQNVAPEILAHELGHAQTHARLGKLYSGGSLGARAIGKFSPLILGTGAYKYFTEKDRDPQKARKWRNRTLGISGLATGLMLADEIEASRKGLKMLKEIGERRPGQARSLARALGTYGATFGTPLALAGGIYAWDAHRTRKKARETMAANTKQASAKLKFVLKNLL